MLEGTCILNRLSRRCLLVTGELPLLGGPRPSATLHIGARPAGACAGDLPVVQNSSRRTCGWRSDGFRNSSPTLTFRPTAVLCSPRAGRQGGVASGCRSALRGRVVCPELRSGNRDSAPLTLALAGRRARGVSASQRTAALSVSCSIPGSRLSALSTRRPGRRDPSGGIHSRGLDLTPHIRGSVVMPAVDPLARSADVLTGHMWVVDGRAKEYWDLPVLPSRALSNCVPAGAEIPEKIESQKMREDPYLPATLICPLPQFARCCCESPR